MIKEKKLPNSIRKFIRLEKARIRAQFLDFKKQKELITELYKKVLPVRNVLHSDAGGNQEKVIEPKQEKPTPKAEIKTETKKTKKKKRKVNPIK